MLQGFLGERESALSCFCKSGHYVTVQRQSAPLTRDNLQQGVPAVVANNADYLRGQISTKIMSFKGRPDPLATEALDSQGSYDGEEREEVRIHRLNTRSCGALWPSPFHAHCRAPIGLSLSPSVVP